MPSLSSALSRNVFGKAICLVAIALLVLIFGTGAAFAQLNAYVSNLGSNTISVIDVATNTIVATIPVVRGPAFLSINAAGSRAYVGSFAANGVVVIDLVTNSVITTVPVATSRAGNSTFSGDGAFLYVSGWDVNMVSVIDTATNTAVATLPVAPRPFAIATTPDGASVWVGHESGAITVIDTATNTVTSTFTPAVGLVRGITFTPDGAFAYVGVREADVCLVVDTATQTVVATIPGDGPFENAITSGGDTVYQVYQVDNRVSVIDTATNTVTATVLMGGTPGGIAITPDDSFAYVANLGGNRISVIDTATNTVVATVPVGATPADVAITRVIQVPPVVTADNAAVTVDEGQTAANTGTVSDANRETVTLTASVGTVINNGNGTWSWSFNTTDGPTQSQTVTITGDDGQGGVTSTTFNLVVNNVAPTITNVSNNGPVLAGAPATITVTATDPAGANDPLAYEFDCGNDGVFEIGPQAGNSAACTFATGGSFTVNVRVADGDGGAATGSTEVTVLPDGDRDGIPDGADNCPMVANPGQQNFDNDAFGDACDPDTDNDGKANAQDLCDFTPAGQPVGRLTGCSIPELCPCAGPAGTNQPWHNHGQYFACVTVSATTFWLEGVITHPQKVQIVTAAAQSSCGR